MPLVQLAEFQDRIAADVARLTLAAHGIEALIFDGGMASLGLGYMTPARLMVEDVFQQRAEAVLSSILEG